MSGAGLGGARLAIRTKLWDAPAMAPDGPLIVGYSEPVSFPELGIERAFAKIDSGAELSSLHGSQPLVVAGGEHVEFTPPLLRRQGQDGSWHPAGVRRVRARLVDERVVRSSSGHEEPRLVIRTDLGLGPLTFPIDLTLSQRTTMSAPVLIGRLALARAPRPVLIDPGRAYLLDLEA